ncbi:MAG: long-chain fatty acid--CoA ligase [Rhodobacterales bacterium]|nr:MAG: long-chain fatty acid--CoA ligase [Rhodobacterales bacterium]
MERVHELLREAHENCGGKLALIDHSDRRATWSGLWQATQEARVVLANAGVGPGDRVVIMLENSISALSFFFATGMLDAAAVMINARLTGAELDRILAHSDPSAVVFTTDVSAMARDHAGARGAVSHAGAYGAVGVLSRDGSVPEPVAAGASATALLLYTSGTTGAPKAAMLSHGNLIAGAEASVEFRGIHPGDMSFLALPLSHVFGLVTLLAITMAHGAMRLEAKFDVARLYEALNTDVTLFSGVPQMHAHLFHYARERGHETCDQALMRFASSGGAPLDPAWKREAEAFYGIPLQNGYGLTETTAGVCATKSELGDPDVSVGLPMKGSVLRIDMEAPGSHPEQGIGEIQVSGPQIMQGYFRDPDQTAEVITEDGFFRTGDLGRIDDQGRLHISGRSKELIIRSGFNVYPVEVEAALIEHPDVIVAAVVGRAVEGNEEVLGFVKVSPGVTVDEAALKTFLKDKLAPYKRPARIIVAHDLPAAPTGKLLKAQMIPHFADLL